MYTNIEDPNYNGDPTEELHKAKELLEWYKAYEEHDDFWTRQLEGTVSVGIKSIEWATEPYTVSMYPGDAIVSDPNDSTLLSSSLTPYLGGWQRR